MPPLENHERHNVKADIHYWPPSNDCLHGHEAEAADKRLGNTYDCSRTMPITDIRGKEDEYNIQEHGFTVLTLPGMKRYEYDDHWVINNLYKEYESAIKAMYVCVRVITSYEDTDVPDVSSTGADVVVFFNHVQRRAGETIWNPALKDPSKNGPSSYPHVDYCGDSALVNNFIVCRTFHLTGHVEA